MIRCNLAVLLAERDLKITKVSADTGISRTTLTSLSSNSCQGIQLDTLNNLCLYLNINPNDLFPIVPFDISVSNIDFDKNDDVIFIFIKFDIIDKLKKIKSYLDGSIYFYKNSNSEIEDIQIDISLPISDNDEEIKTENQIITKYLKSLPISFLKDIEEKIVSDILGEFDNISDSIIISFTWFDELYQ